MNGFVLVSIALIGLCLGGCSTVYRTGPNGMPIGSPTTTYYGPGAPLGGERVQGPTLPPEAVPPPANLTMP